MDWKSNAANFLESNQSSFWTSDTQLLSFYSESVRYSWCIKNHIQAIESIWINQIQNGSKIQCLKLLHPLSVGRRAIIAMQKVENQLKSDVWRSSELWCKKWCSCGRELRHRDGESSEKLRHRFQSSFGSSSRNRERSGLPAVSFVEDLWLCNSWKRERGN